jgi:formylglycine-generating enzyme required for sulfatase activity
MKLTPLGKALIFLIGLGLVLTAVYRFLPAEHQPWRKWFAGGDAANSEPGEQASQETPPPSGERGASTQESRPESTEPEQETPAQESMGQTASDWVTIPAGTFLSGAGQSEVDLPAFRIQRTEVTNGQYEAFLRECPTGSGCGPREEPSYWEDQDYLEIRRDHPVVFVSWGDADRFCRWEGGRLPTIDQWEKAARGKDGRSFPTGGALDPSSVNILGSDRRDEKARAPRQIPTWGVESDEYARDRSPYGVLGLAGNVSEWTSSASEDEPDLRLAAGGSWDSWDLNDGRTYYRIPKNPTDRSSSLGFRCASAAK